jgi:hypothetical protein
LGNGEAVNTFKVAVIDLDQLKRVVKMLEAIKGVRSVERARSVEG